MKNIWNYLFYDDVYGLAIRPLDMKEATFYTKKPSLNYWYADPFICGHEGKEYVFAEVMDYWQGVGRIGVAEVIDKQIQDFKIIIKEPFHMSFPHIFQQEERWYMVPETGSSRQMRLYEATSFPYEWKLSAILKENVNWVDTVFRFINENKAIGLTYDFDEKVAKPIVLDMENKTMEIIQVDGTYSLERPGGTFYTKEGKMYRVLQDCVRCYGDFMHVFEVKECNEKCIDEIEVGEIHAQDIVFDDSIQKEYTHTYNRDEIYEIIDYRTERFNFFKMFAWAFWKLKRK